VYRVEREWKRYEGNALRELFFELRRRFLARHVACCRSGWALDLGSGPGRFAPALSGEDRAVVLADVSLRMLESAHRHLGLGSAEPSAAKVHLVRADGMQPPFAAGTFGFVLALGNLFGFAGAAYRELWDSTLALVAPAGSLVVEIAPARGERARAARRLPATAFARALRAPVRAVAERVRAGGFEAGSPDEREAHESFEFLSTDWALPALVSSGFRVEESMAVAPVCGADPARAEAARRDSKAFAHLLELEETLGRDPRRWREAAAVLIAARRRAPDSRDGSAEG
jgi:SAM-dependent methyltransferase